MTASTPAIGWRPSLQRWKPFRHLPEGRGLRILEVGAGTGGLTSQVLPLLERGLHSYIFSDVSAAFFPGAKQKLAGFPEVECKVFDLEKPGTEQDSTLASFDFIIGTNVVHAVRDVRATLATSTTFWFPAGAWSSWMWPRRSSGRNPSSVSPAAGGVSPIAICVPTNRCCSARNGNQC